MTRSAGSGTGSRAARPDALSVASCLAIAALAAGAWLPVDGWRFPPCWIKLWTGFPCLSCGLTRSFLQTLRSNWGAAITLHPLGPPLVALCLFLAALPLMPADARRRCERRLRASPTWIGRAVAAGVALLLLNGLYRVWWIVETDRPIPW